MDSEVWVRASWHGSFVLNSAKKTRTRKRTGPALACLPCRCVFCHCLKGMDLDVLQAGSHFRNKQHVLSEGSCSRGRAENEGMSYWPRGVGAPRDAWTFLAQSRSKDNLLQQEAASETRHNSLSGLLSTYYDTVYLLFVL